ncbi:hypothetical protein [Levilactobacillus acidifarinae]|uniref:hypothetical protein n=1 Tax=Levilactobacillus acidifarinae TaxID=267364 RepID=UPI00070F074F|nr:hypothetical protein [Levilactobacillus acidifarinae]GEO70525.1 hypothetical protein LAC03_24350 [Levilactobacillus acidifarinae]
MKFIIDGKEFEDGGVSLGHVAPNLGNPGAIMVGMGDRLLTAMRDNKKIEVKNLKGEVHELQYDLGDDSATISNSSEDYY